MLESVISGGTRSSSTWNSGLDRIWINFLDLFSVVRINTQQAYVRQDLESACTLAMLGFRLKMTTIMLNFWYPTKSKSHQQSVFISAPAPEVSNDEVDDVFELLGLNLDLLAGFDSLSAMVIFTYLK